MTDDLDRLILTQIRGLNRDAGKFASGVLNDDLTPGQQIAYAHRLVDLAEAIRERAQQQPIIIEGATDDRSHRAHEAGR